MDIYRGVKCSRPGVVLLRSNKIRDAVGLNFRGARKSVLLLTIWFFFNRDKKVQQFEMSLHLYSRNLPKLALWWKSHFVKKCPLLKIIRDQIFNEQKVGSNILSRFFYILPLYVLFTYTSSNGESEKRCIGTSCEPGAKALANGNHVQSAYNFIVPCTALPTSPLSKSHHYEHRLTEPNVHLIRVTAPRCNEQISAVSTSRRARKAFVLLIHLGELYSCQYQGHANANSLLFYAWGSHHM